MADSNAQRALSPQSECEARVRSRHYPLLRRGIVPHGTSCDLQHRPLRLRCAPPSSASAPPTWCA